MSRVWDGKYDQCMLLITRQTVPYDAPCIWRVVVVSTNGNSVPHCPPRGLEICPCDVRPSYLRRLHGVYHKFVLVDCHLLSDRGACCGRSNGEEQDMCRVFKKRNVQTSSSVSTTVPEVYNYDRSMYALRVCRVSCHNPTITVEVARRVISGTSQHPDLGGLSESICT